MDLDKSPTPPRRSLRAKRLGTRLFTTTAVLSGLLVVSGTTASVVAQTAPPPPDAPECVPDPAIVSCRFDESAQADLRELRTMVREQFASFDDSFDPNKVEIDFVGKARARQLTTETRDEKGVRDSGEGGEASNDWRVLNPATRNEFELSVPVRARQGIDRLLQRRGDTEPTRGRLGMTGGDSPEGPNAPAQFGAMSFSGGDDSRVRLQPTNSWPWRTFANMGGCSATFIGPRHIVTAAHCLYSQNAAAWSSGFNVEPARDAGNVPFRTTLPPGPGETGWYFTPAAWRQNQQPAGGFDQFDFAVVVVPDRLGEVVGSMGYGYLTDAGLQSRSHLLRGYPLCESETANPERTDEPNPCVVNALYGGDACSIATLSVPDPDGFNRRARHGCDASAANSGSSLYTYLGADPVVSMIHTTSTKCRFAGDPPCTSADTHPLEATRITPEYRSWISYFRSLFP